MLAINSASATLPATRTTNSSPSPVLKTCSGGTRLSAQQTTIANGLWPRASVRRTPSPSGCGSDWPLAKRWLPAFSACRASSGVRCASRAPPRARAEQIGGYE